MIKRFFDLSFAISLLVLLLPLFILISALILITSGRPIFFVQSRVGFKLKVFKMYKFRSMLNNAEHSGTGLFSFSDDSRITPIGSLLRRFSIDELPQLLNILKGEMSFVGPRPPVVYELGPIDEYPAQLNHRFDVIPGITGLAQTSGRNHNNWDQKLALDLKYIRLFRRYGVLYDFFLLVRTFFALFSFKGVVEKEDNLCGDGPISTLARKSFKSS